MEKNKRKVKLAERCMYLKVCYLAEELKCFGYKNDCPLYMRSNNEECPSERFDEAMDKLINKTMAKYQNLLE